MMVSKGININDSKYPWSILILSGEKTIETRDTDSLAPYVDQPLGVIRTGRGGAAVVGFIRLGKAKVYRSVNEFRMDEHLHRVKAGSPFDFKCQKFGYPVEVLHVLDSPIPIDTLGRVSRKIPVIHI